MSNRDTNAKIREFFAKGSDRADSARLNPLFTGREGIIDGLVGHVREVLDSEKPGSGRTHLVYGSQGVGKSELMLQFISKLEQLDLGDLIVMRAPPDALWNAQVFFNAFRSSSSRTAWNTIDERAAELGSIGIAGMVSIARQPKPPITQNDEQQTALLQEFAHVIRNQFNNPAIVLCVDEIQSGMPARSDTPGRWSGFAPRFENGEIDMKIMPVFFGLGNSKERLGNCGLSRLNIANVFQMRGLDDADIRRAARIFLESLEGDQPAHTEAHYWLGAIVKYASGWPRHLSNCLSVIARWSEHSNTRLDARAFGACMREAHEIKQDYYGERIHRCDWLLAVENQERLARLFESSPRVSGGRIMKELHFPSTEAASKALNLAVEAGILHLHSDLHSIAIPSMLSRLRQGERVAYSEMEYPYES